MRISIQNLENKERGQTLEYLAEHKIQENRIETILLRPDRRGEPKKIAHP
jgi:hypothetical protein